MERALKSFLDGISEQDNVVNLEQVVKNDNDDSKVEVIAQGSSSGMLDMRAMAQRYQEMAASGKAQERTPQAPLPGEILRDHLLAPRVEVEEAPNNVGWIIAAAGCGIFVTIVATAVVTATFVRRSVMTEIQHLRALPAVASTQGEPDPAVAVADWPEVDRAILGAAVDEEEEEEEEEEPTMKFRESEVFAVSKSRDRDDDEADELKTVSNPEIEPAAVTQPAAVVASSARPVEAAETPDATHCDEVLCLMEGKGCCGDTRKLAPGNSKSEVDPNLPERLSRADIEAGLQSINGRLNSCGSRHGISGAVTLKLKISSEGKVQKSASNKGEAEFKSCVSNILQKARFATSQKGATLSYPVVLR